MIRRPAAVAARREQQQTQPTSPRSDPTVHDDDSNTARSSNLRNALWGIALGCVFVFVYTAFSATPTTVKTKPGSTPAPPWFPGVLNPAPTPQRGEEPPPPEAGAKLVNGTCRCSRHCLTASCRKITEAASTGNVSHPNAFRLGHGGERERNLLALSLEFSRCEAETCVKSATGDCIANTFAIEKAKCNPPQRRLINSVRKCLIPTLKPPKAFTLERDSMSGYSVVCRGDMPLEMCRSEDGSSQANYFELKKMAELLYEKASAKSNGTSMVRFIDFGDTDGLLDIRMAALPHVAVDVVSMNPEQRSVAHVTGCVNSIPTDKLRVKWYKFANDGARLDRNIIPDLGGGVSTVGTILRVSAPGYEAHIEAELDGTIRALKPDVIVTRANAKSLSSWLIPRGYTMWNPKSCRLAATEDDISRSVVSMRSTVLWVKKPRKDLIQPRCRDACVVATCQDEWRTEYRPCVSDGEQPERCVSDDLATEAEKSHHDGCYWTASSAACKLDSNWQRVMKCADPRLPIAKFSIVDLRGVLVACDGAHDCVGVDTKTHDAALALLVSFVNQIKDGRHVTPEYINVGAFIGNLGFSLSRQGVKVHLFEPIPATRQWIKISKCFNNLGTVRVYDHGIGTNDEDCAIAPDASVMVGNVNVTCPAHPVANRPVAHKFDLIVPFRTLNTVYRQWVYDTEASAAVASNVAQQKAAAAKSKSAVQAAGGEHKSGAVQRAFILHFDDAVDPLPLLHAANQWMLDDAWRPSTIIMSSANIDAAAVERYLGEYGYNAVKMETELPYKVFVHD